MKINSLEFAKAREAFVRKFERTNGLAIARLIREQYADIAAYLEAEGDYGNIVQALDDTKLIDFIREGIYLAFARKFVNKFRPVFDMGKNDTQQDFNSWMLEAFDERIAELTGPNPPFTSLTLENVAVIIRDGIAEGLSRTEIIELIMNAGNVRMVRARADMIARTELGIAQSIAEELLINDTIQVTPLRKFWISVNDDRTREDHRVAGRTYTQRNAILWSDKFTVGPVEMSRPRQQGAPANQVIQCRCQLGYITEEDYQELIQENP